MSKPELGRAAAVAFVVLLLLCLGAALHWAFTSDVEPLRRIRNDMSDQAQRCRSAQGALEQGLEQGRSDYAQRARDLAENMGCPPSGM